MNKQPQISYAGVKYWFCWLICWGSFPVSACGFSTSVTTTITDKENKAQRNWATYRSLRHWCVELGSGTQFILKLMFSNLTLSCFYNLYYKDIHCIVTYIEKMTFWNKNSIRMSFYRRNYKKYKRLFLIMQLSITLILCTMSSIFRQAVWWKEEAQVLAEDCLKFQSCPTITYQVSNPGKILSLQTCKMDMMIFT